MKQYFYIATLLLLLASCAGGRQAATETESPYRRKPIVEVTASELKADSALIEATT